MRLREVVGLSRNHISLLNFEPLENLDSFLIRGKSSEFATQRENHFLVIVMLSSLESLLALLCPPPVLNCRKSQKNRISQHAQAHVFQHNQDSGLWLCHRFFIVFANV